MITQDIPATELPSQLLRRLVSTARALTAMQVSGVSDSVGMTNADSEFARRLANIVEIAGNAEPKAVRLLASLLVRKYQRQTRASFNQREWDTLESVAPAQITAADRLYIRETVTVRRASSDTYEVGWQENPVIYNESTVFSAKKKETARGVAYEIHGGALQPFLARLRSKNIRAVVPQDVALLLDHRTDRRLAPPAATGPAENAIPAWLEGDDLYVRPPHQAAFLQIVRAVPNRVYDSGSKSWRFNAMYARDVWQKFAAAGADTSAFEKLDLSKYADMTPTVTVVNDGIRFGLIFPYDEPLITKVRRIHGAEYVEARRAWMIPRQELWSFDHILQQHERTYDRTAVDAALKTIPAPPVDVAVVIPDHIRKAAWKFQLEGIGFLTQPLVPLRASLGQSLRGFLLADDRGLGKTLEAAVAASLVTPPDERIVVIVPASAKHGWVREIKKWISRDETIGVIRKLEGDLPNTRWLIMSYDMIEPYHDRLKERGIGTLIVDEAHRIKNPLSKRARMVVGHQGRDPSKHVEGLTEYVRHRVYLLTGTPVPNKIKESFNYWRAIGHKYGNNFYRFARRFCDPVTTEFGVSFEGASNIAELRQGIDPIFIQRHKQDVALELPPKIREFREVDINRGEFLSVLKEYRESIGDAKFWKSKAKTLQFFTAATMATAIAKIPATIDLVNDMVADGEKVILFSGSTKVLDLFKEHFGDLAVALDGRKSDKQREAAEYEFNNNPDKMIFLGQWDAAGESLTLTAATQVVFNELSWVPKTHMQAEDRAHRIGQQLPVNVTYMVAAKTLDVEFARILRQKMEIVNSFEGTQDSFFAEVASATRERLSAAQEPRLKSVAAEMVSGDIQTKKRRAPALKL